MFFFKKEKTFFRNISEHWDELGTVAKKETGARRHFLSVFRGVRGVGGGSAHPNT